MVNEGCEPVLDQEFLSQFYGELAREGESDLLPELIQRFLQTVPDKLVVLQGAIEKEDAKTIQYEAHTLLGRSLNLGAKAMAQVCSEIESAGKSNSFQEAKSGFARLTLEYDRACLALSESLRTIQKHGENLLV